MSRWWPFSKSLRRDLAKYKGKAAQMQEWFESAMVMVDNVPVGVAWSDAQNDFNITYVNASGKAMVGPALAGGPGSAVGLKLYSVFPPLADRKAELADPARSPVRFTMPMGALVLDVQVVAIRNNKGVHTGAMAVWSDVTHQTRLANDFEANIKAVVEEMASATGQMQKATHEMASGAGQAERRSIAVTDAAAQATENVQTVAAAAGQLSSSIAEIGRQVEASSSVAGKAVKKARDTDGTVQMLAGAAQQIGDVVGLIQQIANQTNLLALNATIEAARAGEAGKGFAVVASEVKSLANQTAKATEDISAQIAGIQQASGTAVAAIQDIGATIAEVNEIAGAIAAAVEQQSAATKEIADNVRRAAEGTTEVSTNIVEVRQASGEVGAAASLMRASVDRLSTQSEHLRSQVEGFLSEIRAA